MRRRNEDAVYSGRSLFAVADGLGGHTAGDVASTTVIEALRPHDRQVDPADLPTVLGRAVYEANRALRRRIDAEPEVAGMGTTLVAMLWSGTTAVLANVGDSRAYLLRDAGRASGIVQITEDHTYGNLVADADSVPHLAGRISRFLDGRADGRSPDLTARELRSGDRFLLCSDGLSSAVPGELVRDVLRSSNDPEEAADRLVTLAIDHGGPDNITVIVIDVRNAI
ncbi:MULTISPECIES: PP2C family protein-serine/threonine phosphatase [unclassified Streptosporangium]|uniref:PP2C family protein-serine/threonine phosphatase n=1 Tax=unclassified Streptosporangium TaxID=2632669 RepID=UPI002E2C00C1|nr:MULTISPECIES: protein phosphatase 2C domain-containing protein [unclassified Streptosporangium]